MLLGIWKNIEELEEEIGLDELKLIINSSRDKWEREQRFLAAINGINLDEGASGSVQDRFDEVQRRVEAKLSGIDKETFELNELGMDVEIEE